jgi:hypothetical protein
MPNEYRQCKRHADNFRGFTVKGLLAYFIGDTKVDRENRILLSLIF